MITADPYNSQYDSQRSKNAPRKSAENSKMSAWKSSFPTCFPLSIHDDSDGNKEVPGAPGTCSEYDEVLKGSVEDTPPIKINQKDINNPMNSG